MQDLILTQSYDEHRKLYYDELTGTWIKNSQKFHDAASSSSSSVPVSLPCTQADYGDSSSGSSSEMICGDDVAVDDYSNIDQLRDEKCKLLI